MQLRNQNSDRGASCISTSSLGDEDNSQPHRSIIVCERKRLVGSSDRQIREVKSHGGAFAMMLKTDQSMSIFYIRLTSKSLRQPTSSIEPILNSISKSFGILVDMKRPSKENLQQTKLRNDHTPQTWQLLHRHAVLKSKRQF